MSLRTINNWLSNIDKDAKEAQEQRIFDLWLACYAQDEIAEIEDIDKATVSRKIDDLLQNGKLSKMQQIQADHAVDFDIPLYNVWTKNAKTNSVSHYRRLSHQRQDRDDKRGLSDCHADNPLENIMLCVCQVAFGRKVFA